MKVFIYRHKGTEAQRYKVGLMRPAFALRFMPLIFCLFLLTSIPVFGLEVNNIPILLTTKNVQIRIEPTLVVPGEQVKVVLETQYELKKVSCVLQKLGLPFEQISDRLWVTRFQLPEDFKAGLHRIKVYLRTTKNETYLSILRLDVAPINIAQSETKKDVFKQQQLAIEQLQNKLMLMKQSNFDEPKVDIVSETPSQSEVILTTIQPPSDLQASLKPTDSVEEKISELQKLVDELEAQVNQVEEKSKSLNEEKQDLESTLRMQSFYQAKPFSATDGFFLYPSQN